MINDELDPNLIIDGRGSRIVAKTIYRKLRSIGCEDRELIAVASALLGLAAESIRDDANLTADAAE